MSTPQPARVQPGIPTGGQFANEVRTEPDLTLGSAPTSGSQIDNAALVSAALGDMAADAGAAYPYRFEPAATSIIAAQVQAFVDEHRDDLEQELDDPADTGWMIGRDFNLARNTRPSDPRHTLAFEWVRDPSTAAALRESARGLGSQRLVAADDGVLALHEADLRSYQARDPETDPQRLAQIVEPTYPSPDYDHWTKVYAAMNPSTPVASLELITTQESDTDFHAAVAAHPHAPAPVLAWAASTYDSRARDRVLDHQNTDQATVETLHATLSTELAEAQRTLDTEGVSPMRQFNVSQVQTLTALVAKAGARLKR